MSCLCFKILIAFNVKTTLKKKLTYFATKSGENITSSRRAGSTLQSDHCFIRRKKLKTMFLCFFDFVDDVVLRLYYRLYDIQIKTN
jgi:hypothetical protein